MANINLCLILNTSHALIKATILARWGMRYYFYVTLMQRISISVRHEWLILIISDPKICMSSISEHFFFASSQIIIHGSHSKQVANFPVFFSFFYFRAVHEYHHHNMAAAASYSGLLLGGARSLGHHTSHHAAHHAHAAASYKEWTSTTPSQSLVDASSAPPYPHGHYAPLSGK